MRCSVFDCRSSNKTKPNKNCNFYSFPSDKETLQQWIQFCQRKEFSFKTSRICMLHFQPDDFENDREYKMGFTKKRRLKKGSVPTIRTGDVNEFLMIDKECTKAIEKKNNEKIVTALLQQYEEDLKQKEHNENSLEMEHCASSYSTITESEESYKNKKRKKIQESQLGDVANLHQTAKKPKLASEPIAGKNTVKDNAKNANDIISIADSDEDMFEEYLIEEEEMDFSAEQENHDEQSEEDNMQQEENCSNGERMPIINEKLIEAVRKHKLLWCSKYKIKNKLEKKELLWKRVGKSLNTDGYLCKRRWKTLRDRFLKAKKGLASKGHYYEQLKFLETNKTVIRKRINNEGKRNPDVNEEKLLLEIKKYPALYDLDSEDYKDMKLKDKIWKSIAHSLNADRFICQTVWSYLLRTYKVKRNRFLPPWEFTEHMRFLENVRYFTRQKSENICSEEEEEEDIQTENLAPLSSLKLILEVKQHEILYNPNLKDFDDNKKRNNAWNRIAKNLKHNVQGCKERWQDLCNIYNKYRITMSMGDKDTTDMSAQYVESMSFLDVYYQDLEIFDKIQDKPKTSTENYDIDDDEYNIELDGMTNAPVEQLIEEVKLHEILYNTNLPDYKDNITKNIIWQEIGKSLGLKAQVCKELWKNIYNSYIVPINNKLDEETGVWISNISKYEKQLRFLNEFIDKKSMRALVTSELSDQIKCKLIDEIQKRPALYNKNLKRYNFLKKQREKDWLSIKQELNIDVETGLKLWRNLRHEFKKYKVRKLEDPNTTWKFAQQMSFLDEIIIANTEYNNKTNPIDMMKVKLIQEVEKHPVLYDAAARKRFHCLEEQFQAWQTVSEAMDRSVSACKLEWKRLRKSCREYFGKRKKNQVKKWKYAPYFEFLNGCYSVNIPPENDSEFLHSTKIKIIEEVKKRPILYNAALPEYVDYDKRNIEWERLSELINVDVKTCKSIWRALRCRYNRAGMNGEWRYAHLLRFLEDNSQNANANENEMKTHSQSENSGSNNFIEQTLFLKKLIKEVKSYMVIHRLPGGSEQEITNAWTNISKALNTDVASCRKKWEYLKNNYQTSKTAKRPWIFMKDMQFLGKHFFNTTPQVQVKKLIQNTEKTEFIDVQALNKNQKPSVAEDSIDSEDTLTASEFISDNESGTITNPAAAASSVSSDTKTSSKNSIDIYLDFLQADIIEANITFEQTIELKSCLSALVYSKLTTFRKS